MFSRILFPVDDDESLPAAVPVVAAYALRWNAEVRVLHVHQVNQASVNGAERRLVKSVIDRLDSAGVRAQGEIRPVRQGETLASVIAQAAIECGADLVAIGSHGRSGLGALFLGSVSHAVTAALRVPVLIIRTVSTRPPDPGRILVAVDGSTACDQAVKDAADVASAFGAAVHVLHVRQVMATHMGTIVEPGQDSCAATRRALDILERRGLRATEEIAISQSVASAIVAAADRTGAGLVVLGSRRPSDLAGLLVGSTAHSIIHRLRCPVLLARQAEVASAGRHLP